MSNENNLENQNLDPSLEAMEENGGDESPSTSEESHSEKPRKPKSKRYLGEYLHELREENKKLRLESQDNLRKAEEANKNSTEALKKVEQSHKSYQDRLVRAELKALASKVGMIDLDDVRFADLSNVKFSDDGEIMGAQEAIEQLKTRKPHYFKANSSSATHESPSPSSEINREDAMQLSDEEYLKRYPRKWRKI